MIRYTLIDNFFENVDDIRQYALLLDYTKSSKHSGWKGFRTESNNADVFEYIKSKLIQIDKEFENINLEVYFHYSLDDTKKEIKNRLHKDATDWAGVIYLTPNPPLNSGTTLHTDSGELIYNIENKYNRFILYRGNTLHGVLDTFGNDINDARITITIFGNVVKSIKTLI